MFSHWILSDSKFPQVPRTLLSILADLNVVDKMVCTRPFISISSNPCINHLLTVPRAPIIIVITVTYMFHSLLIPKQRSSTYLSCCFFSILLSGQSWQQSLHFGKFSFLVDYWPGLGDQFLSKNPREILDFWELFPEVSADGFSLDFEWQQVSSNFQDSSQYSY